MGALWLILIAAALMVLYVVIVVRASIRGEQWARDTLEAAAYLAEGPGALPPRLMQEPEAGPEPGAEPEDGTVAAELVA